jgi:hypothetical protein
MPRASETTSHQQDASRISKSIGPIVIKPGQMERVELGVFHERDTPPRFQVEYQKDYLNTVSFHDGQIPHGNGTYRLIRRFQNFGERAVTIRVKVRHIKPIT